MVTFQASENGDPMASIGKAATDYAWLPLCRNVFVRDGVLPHQQCRDGSFRTPGDSQPAVFRAQSQRPFTADAQHQHTAFTWPVRGFVRIQSRCGYRRERQRGKLVVEGLFGTKIANVRKLDTPQTGRRQKGGTAASFDLVANDGKAPYPRGCRTASIPPMYTADIDENSANNLEISDSQSLSHRSQ